MDSELYSEETTRMIAEIDSERFSEETRRMMAVVNQRNPEMTPERIMEISRQLSEVLNDDLYDDDEDESPDRSEIEKLQDSTWEIDGGGTLTIKDGVNMASIQSYDETRFAHDLTVLEWDASMGTIEFVGVTNGWDQEEWWETFEVELTVKYLPDSDTIRGIINAEKIGTNDRYIGSFIAKRKDDSSE